MNFTKEIEIELFTRTFKFFYLDMKDVDISKFINIDSTFLENYDYLLVLKSEKNIKDIFCYKKGANTYINVGIGYFEENSLKVCADVYELHGGHINEEKNVFTIYGHENIINVYLDDFTYNNIYTR